MSYKSIALFEAHRADRTTLPPPPADDPIAQLEASERKYAHRASRALERARECRAMIELLRGRDAIESGSVDDNDYRHPNHSLNCVRPCCSRREIDL